MENPFAKDRAGWIVCQLGAREHYAIARSLAQHGALEALVTDLWIRPSSLISSLPLPQSLRGRHSVDLEGFVVYSCNPSLLAFEGWRKIRKIPDWDEITLRNSVYQKSALKLLTQRFRDERQRILFSYSYASRHILEYAKSRGWFTVLGQIDPGPVEERLVLDEQCRYPNLGDRWLPAPAEYWSSWRREVQLADRVVVNSAWSRKCLINEGIEPKKIVVVPLAYGSTDRTSIQASQNPPCQSMGYSAERPLRLLFLGQVLLRKGIGRLLDAMRMIQDMPIRLTIAGPSKIPDSAWSDLKNVRWIGSLPRSRTSAAFQDADLFVLPTVSDGFALTQLESLANCLPVLASKFCGDVVDDGVNGFLLEENSPEEMAALFRRLASDPEILTGMRRACNVKREFTLDSIGRTLISLE